MIEFEWNEAKNEQNRKKHGIWFEEATQVFDDPHALLFHDSHHSTDEDRFILLGMNAHGKVLVVIHCERQGGSKIRIISARKAIKKEIKRYEEGI